MISADFDSPAAHRVVAGYINDRKEQNDMLYAYNIQKRNPSLVTWVREHYKAATTLESLSMYASDKST